MNINVSLPTIIPNQLQPQTDAVRVDNRRAPLIPLTSKGDTLNNTESEVGSQKEKSRASQVNANSASQVGREGSQTSIPQTPVTHPFVEAAGEEGQRKQQQDPKQQQQQQQQQQQVQELVDRDLEVHNHEQAHQSTGGQYAGSPIYHFSMGPDGKRYAVGGEVAIDVGVIPGDPAATVAKMKQVRAAALAPTEPSSQDLSVARSAADKEAIASQALAASRVTAAKPSGVLDAYMEQRNQVIAQRYQQAVKPASQQGFSLRV